MPSTRMTHGVSPQQPALVRLDVLQNNSNNNPNNNRSREGEDMLGVVSGEWDMLGVVSVLCCRQGSGKEEVEIDIT